MIEVVLGFPEAADAQPEVATRVRNLVVHFPAVVPVSVYPGKK
eukprot:COSAG05_NODE_920_length_6588_cov_5.627061_1_plen_43_part_00